MKKIIIILSLVIVFVGVAISAGLMGGWKKNNDKTAGDTEKIKIVTEESVVIGVVEKAGSSVVTVAISTTKKMIDPFYYFNEPNQELQKVEQDIGTGFVISKDGLIVTNKHVVSDLEAKYKIIGKDDKTYQVTKIYRDPVNDLAILQIEPSSGGLKPLELGDSSKLKVGQFVVAIGTALGEFRNTVTTGVISGLGRGITAGNPFEQEGEKLNNVIQTDAAINPGNSGGPLINSKGQVIGVNIAVASGGQNIGFAIPVNVIKESLNNFNATGQFSRPFLGVKYRMISRKLAILNELPEGAYLDEVVVGSPAEKAGLQQGDIITKIDGKLLRESEGGLVKAISTKKVGDILDIEFYREEITKKIKITLEENSG